MNRNDCIHIVFKFASAESFDRCSSFAHLSYPFGGDRGALKAHLLSRLIVSTTVIISSKCSKRRSFLKNANFYKTSAHLMASFIFAGLNSD